ncbi:hypothetical protein EHS25_003859 [Saitozyma podzolica]|uniref:Uncharacterized protein n=1 Tax=Saitozyma podzolica TaxID=1890683 RepID=A0A427Y3Q7_9TREE|nr:hypothetical protein EHS25_003859 [Saitozyma podzolica]
MMIPIPGYKYNRSTSYRSPGGLGLAPVSRAEQDVRRELKLKVHSAKSSQWNEPATERLLPAQSPSPPSVEWQHSMISDVPERPYPTYDELSYDDYLTKHVLPNTPFLLSAKATAHWPAVKAWRRRRARATETVTGGEELDPGSSSSSLRSTDPSPPNLPALRRYAHHLVPVANTHLRCFSEFERTELPLGEVLDAWERETGREGLVHQRLASLRGDRERGGRADGVYAVPECLRGE